MSLVDTTLDARVGPRLVLGVPLSTLPLRLALAPPLLLVLVSKLKGRSSSGSGDTLERDRDDDFLGPSSVESLRLREMVRRLLLDLVGPRLGFRLLAPEVKSSAKSVSVSLSISSSSKAAASSSCTPKRSRRRRARS